jgi:hypothetical protein
MQGAHAIQTEHTSEAASRPGRRVHRRGPGPGIVFVPCVLCLDPVDLTTARETGGRPMCEPHRAADGVSAGLRLT